MKRLLSINIRATKSIQIQPSRQNEHPRKDKRNLAAERE